MKRKLLCLFVVMTLIVSLFGVTLPAVAQGDVYVDASNVADPSEDGSIDHPFDKIQEGIDAATSGDTVQVAAGTYVENVVLPGGIDLIGAGPGQSIVDGASAGYTIDATGSFTIKGFTITGGGSYGIAYGASGASLIEGNEVTGNNAGIYVWGVGATTTIQNNVVHHNTNNGILIYSGSTATIVNNTVDNNSFGIVTIGDPPPVLTITNNIVTNNGAEGISFHYASADSTLSNNDVWNHGIDYDTVSPGTGDISADPLFVNAAAGDYHLQPGSPCIDTGTNTGAPADDFEGDPRPVDGNGDTVATVDMGAYEYVPGETALSFNGTTNYVDTNLTTDLSGSGDFTVEAWIKADTSAGRYAMSQSHSLDPYSSDWIIMFSQGEALFWMRSATLSAPAGFDGTQWNYLALVWNSSAETYEGFVNGASVGTSGTVSGYGGVGSIKIGASGNATSSFFDGTIDEVRISNTARSSAEIDANWNGGTGQKFAEDEYTLALWHMDGTGGTLSDETGINNGTIYGATRVLGFQFPAEEELEVISQIVFTTLPQTLLVNQISEIMTIQTRDTDNNPVNVAANTTINLDSTSLGGEFSLWDGQWTPTSSVTVSAGQSSAIFYYKDSTIGTPTITAAEDPSADWTDAIQDITVRGPVHLWRGEELIGTYFAIQEAIDNAVDGDDIVVFPGIYQEQIVIDKQVTVKSKDTDTTIIDADEGTALAAELDSDMFIYPAVWIQRDGVVFGDEGQGFTIRNTYPIVWPEGEESPSDFGIAILADAPGCTIRGNVIEDSNPVGIFANEDTNIISQNTVSASIVGIIASSEQGSTITWNIVNSAMLYGIQTGGSGSDISWNTVSNNFGGAIIVGGDDSQVTNNDLLDNQGTAIMLEHVSQTTVSENYISSDATDTAGIYGIQVEGGQNNNISDNDISDVLVGGITLSNTDENSLSSNEIYDIDGYDLWGGNGGDAFWTREEARFDRYSVKLWTGENPGGGGLLGIPTSFPFERFGMGGELGGELYFWAYLEDTNVLPEYWIELDNGVILKVDTDCEAVLQPEQWLKLSAPGFWTHTNTPDPESKSLSAWIDDPLNADANVVYVGVIYSGAVNKTMYIDGSWEEGMGTPIEPPKGIVISESNSNSVSGNTVSYVNGTGILIVESRENMIGDGNTISNNGSGVVIGNSRENTVSGSTISNNQEGIIITRSYSNQIIGNDIMWNTGGMSGVHLDGESECNEIHANNIAGNTAFGVVKDGDWGGTTGWVNASGNWWGDASGPSGAGPGSGDAVNEFVDFELWAKRWPDVTEPTMEASLAMPRMTAVLGMFMGDVGPEWSSLVVEAYDDEGGVGIARVTVNLRELLMQMLPPYPIVIDMRNDNPPFDDIRVREAMSMAIDYDTLRSELGGYGNIVLNPEEGLPTEYNPAAAIQLLVDANAGGFQTEIYMHWDYIDTGLASMLWGYWDDIGVDCEIRVVDMGELSSRIYNREYEQMVCIPYAWEIIPRDKVWQWQNWLNELERSHLWHQGNEVYRRDFELQDDFMNQLRWYLGEDDTQQMMDKLTLGDFSIPVTVADWCGNEVSGNIALTIVDIMQPLEEGWNLVSTPVTLDDSYATWADIVALGDGLLCDDAIRYDPDSGWVGVIPGYKLKPLEAIYVHATGNDQIGIIFNRGVTPPPSLYLNGGWNLVGLAIPPDKWDSMPVNRAMVTVEDASGNRGYSVVVSPDQRVDYNDDYRYWDTEGREYGFGWYGWRFQQESWDYAAGFEPIPKMSVGGGYWVFMEAADTLAGFSTTPVTSVSSDEKDGHDLDPIVPRYDWQRVTRTDYVEYRDGKGYTEIYLTYSGDVSPGRVVEFYQLTMAEQGWTLTPWEVSADSASLDFTMEMGDATASCHIDVVGGESIDILFKLWEPGVDLPDVPRFEWRPVAMTAYSQTPDDFDTQTNISYEGELEHFDAYKFYQEEMGQHHPYDWENIGDEDQNEFAWLMLMRHDEENRTYLCLIWAEWAERGLIEIEHHQFAASVPDEYIDSVISLWRQEIEMRMWAMWGWGEEEEEEPQPPG